MKTIYVVRHAKAEGQPRESHLTMEGNKQAEQLVHFFQDKPIDRIISSPFLRTLQTIQPLAEMRKLPIIQDERLAERVLSSRDYPDWKEQLSLSFENFEMVLEGGESNQSGYERACSILEEIIQGDDKNVILVTHGNLMTLLLRYFNDKAGIDELFALSNPDVYEISINGEQKSMTRIWI